MIVRLVPQNQTQIAQSDACSAYEETRTYNNCALGYLNYGQIATSNLPGDQISALHNIYQLLIVNGTGKGTSVPTTLTNGQGTCTQTAGCANNGANFGSVLGVIGGARAITMQLHVNF